MATAAIGLVVYLLGLCVGSFLNVVVYRLPRGLSISQPVWSFCPSCRSTLRWYDNIPVLSWLMLKARCRYCGKPISPQYPLVEAVTGLIFVLVYYLLYVTHARVAVSMADFAVYVHPAWPRDAALLLGWLILVAVLIACSAMDLILYLIDTRVTDVALLGGLVCYALWPAPTAFHQHVAEPLSAATFVAALISGVMMWRANRAQSGLEEMGVQAEDRPEDATQPRATMADRAAVVIAILLFVGLAFWILATDVITDAGVPVPFRQYVVPAALVALFVAMVLTGGQMRAIDDEIHAAIEAEAPEARRTALRECLWLMPAALGGLAAYLLVWSVPVIDTFWSMLVNWEPSAGLTPIGGVAFSLQGAIFAATAGWGIRIFFTLAFGREAFGTGDIYILAAAGAIAGWDIALLGFLLAIPIALLGWLLSLVLKRTGMIPFGPPLALGFLTALWLNGPAAITLNGYAELLVQAWNGQRSIVLMGIGLLLVVLPVAIILARMARRFVEPVSSSEPPAER